MPPTTELNADKELLATMPESLLDQLATAIICLDEKLCLSYLNQAAEGLFSVNCKRVLGEHCQQWSGVPEPMIDRLHNALATLQPFSDRQMTLRWPGRDIVVVDCVVSLWRAESSTPGLLMEFMRVDRQLRIARDDALMAQQEHNRMFLRGLAHEIRNPLGGLRGAAQLLERELPEPELKDYTRVIIREADRLQHLMDSILGPASAPDIQSVNVHDPLEHVRKIIHADAPDHVVIRTDYDPSIPEFASDRDRLTQVFLNIAINALNAIGELGTITFESRIRNNFTLGGVCHPLVIAIRIIDNGPGVKPALMERLFHPLVTGQPGGTGLGLSIAQQAINQLGGLIKCDSQPGNTQFTVLIPLEQK